MRRSSGLLLAAVVILNSAAFGQKLTQLAEVPGPQPSYYFGTSVAISGDTIVVGAPRATVGCSGQPSCGAAYVFVAVNGDWGNLAQVATLTPSNGATDGGFGGAVAISGGTIVVSGTDSAGGAVYVFVEPASGWTDMSQTAELTVSTPVGNLFSVAVDGTTVVVGAPESLSNTAYVYVEPTGGWVNMTQTAELESSLSQDRNSLFGVSVAISGKNVVVGASLAPVGSISEEGLAFLFVEPSAGWKGTIPQRTEFMASDGGANWVFGASVSVNGNTAVVGAPGANVGSKQNQGVAYIFTKPLDGWPKSMSETAKLVSTDGRSADRFGYSVALNGGRVAVGAPYKGSLRGAFYLFSAASASQDAEAIAADGAPNDLLGGSVVIGNQVVVVGAPGYPSGNSMGAAYVFGKTR